MTGKWKRGIFWGSLFVLAGASSWNGMRLENNYSKWSILGWTYLAKEMGGMEWFNYRVEATPTPVPGNFFGKKKKEETQANGVNEVEVANVSDPQSSTPVQPAPRASDINDNPGVMRVETNSFNVPSNSEFLEKASGGLVKKNGTLSESNSDLPFEKPLSFWDGLRNSFRGKSFRRKNQESKEEKVAVPYSRLDEEETLGVAGRKTLPANIRKKYNKIYEERRHSLTAASNTTSGDKVENSNRQSGPLNAHTHDVKWVQKQLLRTHFGETDVHVSTGAFPYRLIVVPLVTGQEKGSIVSSSSGIDVVFEKSNIRIENPKSKFNPSVLPHTGYVKSVDNEIVVVPLEDGLQKALEDSNGIFFLTDNILQAGVNKQVVFTNDEAMFRTVPDIVRVLNGKNLCHIKPKATKSRENYFNIVNFADSLQLPAMGFGVPMGRFGCSPLRSSFRQTDIPETCKANPVNSPSTSSASKPATSQRLYDQFSQVRLGSRMFLNYKGQNSFYMCQSPNNSIKLYWMLPYLHTFRGVETKASLLRRPYFDEMFPLSPSLQHTCIRVAIELIGVSWSSLSPNMERILLNHVS